MQVAIIEDNVSAQELLIGLLKQYFPELRAIGPAATLQDGVALINKYRPELLLLDIQLRDGQVFDLLKRLDRDYLDRAGLIFITAFSTMENMYQALRMSAIDYLTKPIDDQHFRTAVSEAISRVGRQPTNERLEHLEQLMRDAGSLQKVPVHLPRGVIQFIPLEQILYLEGEENITYFHLLDGRRISAMRHLGFYERSLEDTGTFFRVSKPLIIHLKYIHRYDAQEHKVYLTGPTMLLASRRRGRALADLLRVRGT